MHPIHAFQINLLTCPIHHVTFLIQRALSGAVSQFCTEQSRPSSTCPLLAYPLLFPWHKFYLYPSSSTCPPSYSLHLAPHVSVHAMSSTWYTLPSPPLHKSKSQLSFNPSMASFVIFPLMTEAHNDSTTHFFWIPILLHSTQWYT